MMQVLADELEANTSIRVNSINPGATRTSMRARAYPGEDPNTLLVPGPALVESQVGTQVYVVGADNKVESRTVEVGQNYKQQWIIKKGLKAGERVIYEGVQKVRPGMVVNTKSS